MSNWWRIDPKSWYTLYHPPSIIENFALFYKPIIASIIYPYIHVMNMISLIQRLSDPQKFKTKSPQRLPAFPASKASFVAARAAAIATLRGFERLGFLMFFAATEFFPCFFLGNATQDTMHLNGQIFPNICVKQRCASACYSRLPFHKVLLEIPLQPGTPSKPGF